MTWGAGSPKNESAVHATEDETPVSGSNAGIYTFTKAVRPCYFRNTTSGFAYITINSDTDPTATEYDVRVATLQDFRLDFLGAINVTQLRILYVSITNRVDPIGWLP